MYWTLCLGISLLLAPSLGYPTFQEQIPNARNVPHPCKANYMWPGVGHKNPLGGGARNNFGEDFDLMGYSWSTELCMADSDGDGKTNGEELGDPSCTWRPGQIPDRTTDITHPGICDPYDSELCKGRTDFVSCELDTFEACDRINNPDVQTLDLKFSETPIPATETNYYCMTFDLPSDQDYHIIATEALMDNINVLHHMLIYGCDNPDEAYIPSPSPCGMSNEGDCGSIIAGWTVGQTGECYDEGIGFRIGQTAFKRVRLEIHYNNPRLISTYTDSSGIRLYIQPAKPDVKDLVTFSTGQVSLQIPPGQREVVEVGVCPSDCSRKLFTKPAYVIAVLNHMHYMGRSMKIELFRDGRLIKTLSNDEYYSYDNPITHVHEPPVEILPGDEIKTTCVYSSLSKDRWVYYGDGTNDEMCFGFLTLYPADAVSVKYCVSSGPLSICDLYGGVPIGSCDWVTFTNLSHPTNSKLADSISKNCNLNGFCRPECKQTLMQLEGHPCLEGEAAILVKERLSKSKEGLAFLGRLHSCPMDHSTGSDVCSTDECSKYCWDDDDDDNTVYDSAHKMTAGSAITMVLTSLFVAVFH